MSDLMARMGELCASATPGDSLVALGLGSCIGLVLLDRRKGVAGLAHIVLPAADGHGKDLNPLKFADKAVPELLRQVVALGGRKPMLEAIVVGGASMFAGAGSTLEVGVRNAAAVKAALAAERIRVHAEDTGGTKGRTVRVDPITGIVTVRKAGAKDEQLYPAVSPFSPKSRVLQEVA
jgi:chemotaxis protein CheD